MDKDEIMKKLFTKEAVTGWLIVLMGVWLVYLSIDPLINDTKNFIRIVGSIFFGGIFATAVIMKILEWMLPNDKN